MLLRAVNVVALKASKMENAAMSNVIYAKIVVTNILVKNPNGIAKQSAIGQ